MKRILSIILVICILVTFTGCDMLELTSFMGKMQSNVAGMSTAGSEKLDASIDNMSSTKHEVKTDEDLKDEKIANADSGVKVGGDKGVSVSNKELADAQKKLGEGEELKTLDSLTPEKKDQLLKDIGKASQNEADKKATIEKMSKPAPAEQASGVKGTAAVVSVVAESNLKKIEDEMKKSNPEATLPPEVSAAVNNITKTLDELAQKPADQISKADVAIVSLVESFATKTVEAASSIDTTTNEMDPVKQEELVQEAADLYSALNILSSASTNINVNDIIKQATDAAGGASQASRALTRESEAKPDKAYDLGIKIDAQYFDYAKMVFEVVNPVFAEAGIGGTDKVFSDLSLTKLAYETFITYEKPENIKNNPVFKDLNNFVRYVITAALVEADNYVDMLIAPIKPGTVDTPNPIRENLEAMGLDFETLVPGEVNAWMLLDEIYHLTEASLKEGQTGKLALKIPGRFLEPKLKEALDGGNRAEALAYLQEKAKDLGNAMMADENKELLLENPSLIGAFNVLDKSLFDVFFPEGVEMGGQKLDRSMFQQLRDQMGEAWGGKAK